MKYKFRIKEIIDGTNTRYFLVQIREWFLLIPRWRTLYSGGIRFTTKELAEKEIKSYAETLERIRLEKIKTEIIHQYNEKNI